MTDEEGESGAREQDGPRGTGLDRRLLDVGLDLAARDDVGVSPKTSNSGIARQLMAGMIRRSSLLPDGPHLIVVG